MENLIVIRLYPERVKKYSATELNQLAQEIAKACGDVWEAERVHAAVNGGLDVKKPRWAKDYPVGKVAR